MRSIFKQSLYNIQQTLFLLVIFLLPTQLGKHFWPSFSIVYGLRLDYLSPTIYVTDILIILLLLVWLIRKISAKGRSASGRKNYKLQIILAIFLFLITSGAVFSDRPPLGIYGLVKLCEFVVFGWMTASLISGEKIFQKTLMVYACGMLMQSLLTIAQFYNQGSLGGILYFLGERTFTSQTPGIANASLNGALLLRPYGTLPHPNVLAGYLLIGMVLLISNIKYQISNIKKIFLSGIIALSSIALLLSMSRSAIFLGVLLLGLYIGSALRSEHSGSKTSGRKNYKLIILLLVLLCIGSIYFFPPLASRFLSIDLGEEAIAERGVLAKVALQMFIDHPLFGVGLGHFLIRLPGYLAIDHVPIQPVHNIYFLIAAETGIIGLLLFLIVLYYVYKKTKLSLKAQGTTLAFFVILCLGLTDHYLLTLQQGRLLLTLVIGLSYARFTTTFGLIPGKIKRTNFVQK